MLLDGMGSGSGSAANGLLSMIPGMFTSLLGGCGSSSCSGYGVDVVSEMVLVVMEMIVALTVFQLN